MASSEYWQKRVTGKEAELKKLRAKLARIQKAESTGWIKNPYMYDESDLKYTMRDIAEAERVLEALQLQLMEAKDKEASRNIPAVIDFLCRWKEHCMKYYGDMLDAVFKAKIHIAELEEHKRRFRYGTDEYQASYEAVEAARKNLKEKLHGKWTRVKVQDYRTERWYLVDQLVERGEWEPVQQYVCRTLTESMEILKKHVDQEAARKYDDLIERVCAKVGEIVNADDLRVGKNGELNGIIAGTKASVNVKTIGAGGYNIQCFHFRTLVNVVK